MRGLWGRFSSAAAPVPPQSPPPRMHGAGDWVLLLVVAALAAALSRLSDGARPAVAWATAALPLLLGAWWGHSAGSVDEDSGLAFLWSLIGLAFVGVFCAAMFGVRGKVCDEDLDRAMIDAVSLFLSFAPAGHAALLWLSQGSASFVGAVAAGLTGAVVGAIARKLRLPGHLRVVGLVVSFLAACALALSIQDGHLCLVAWYSACIARAYEIGLREEGKGSELCVVGRSALLATSAILYLRV